MPPSPWLSTMPADVLKNPSVLMVGSSPLVFGASRGGIRFEPGFEYENPDFDGKHSPIYLMDRKFYGPAKLTGTMLQIGESGGGAQVTKYEAGAAEASAGSPNVTTITPLDGGAFLAAGSYLSLLRCIWDRGVGSGTERYFEVLFTKALCTKYAIQGGGRDLALIEVEFEARKDMSSGDLEDAPYLLQYRESLPA